jgi:hypothetical protein
VWEYTVNSLRSLWETCFSFKLSCSINIDLFGSLLFSNFIRVLLGREDRVTK